MIFFNPKATVQWWVSLDFINNFVYQNTDHPVELRLNLKSWDIEVSLKAYKFEFY